MRVSRRLLSWPARCALQPPTAGARAVPVQSEANLPGRPYLRASRLVLQPTRILPRARRPALGLRPLLLLLWRRTLACRRACLNRLSRPDSALLRQNSRARKGRRPKRQPKFAPARARAERCSAGSKSKRRPSRHRRGGVRRPCAGEGPDYRAKRAKRPLREHARATFLALSKK